MALNLLHRSCSKRAYDLYVKASRLEPQDHEESATDAIYQTSLTDVSNEEATTSPASPLPLWWDEIFDANDLNNKLRHHKVKRKLISVPPKGTVASEHLQKTTTVDFDINISSILHQNDFDVTSPNKTVTLETCGSSNLIFQETMLKVPSEQHGEQENFESTVKEKQESRVTSTKANLKESLTAESNKSVLINVHNLNVSASDSFPVERYRENCKDLSRKVKNVYPSHAKIHEAKVALNSGRKHTTVQGRIRQARQVRPPCPENCKRCHNPRISHEDRLKINDEFWKLGNHCEQWKFIRKSLEVHSPMKKFVASGCKRGKLLSRSYFFILNGESRKVCKTMFKNTLCICDSWVDSAISHCTDSSVREDGRGMRYKLQEQQM